MGRDNSAIPICVDLDGTLVNTDILWESMIKLCKGNPLYLLRLIAWRLRGRAFLKKKVAERVSVQSEFLPYNQKVLAFLQEAKAQNRPLVLATGSHITEAKKVAQHLGCFEQVFASDGNVNLTRENKQKSLVQAFGEKGFWYIGNSRDDVPCWKKAQAAYFVNTPLRIQKQVANEVPFSEVIDQKKFSWRVLMKQLRVHQWVKNTLLFVPLITSHTFHTAIDALIAFFSFSFLSSAVYIFNDLCDLESDRQHPTKKDRPLASGALSIQFGIGLIFTLIPLSFCLASLLPERFVWIVVAYSGLNLSYNLSLKARPILDVLCLSSLYLLRVLGGHAVTGVPLSSWLTTFALFFFLSLALIKRFTEMTTKKNAVGRGYLVTDATYISILGLTSSAIAILVFALYLNSEQVVKMYRSPEYLWFFIPILFYWINRLWLKAFRQEMHDDPVAFALKDRISYCLLGMILLVVFLAS